MPHCYMCDEEITKANRTKEHILLNAIGGRLKSTELICRTCNSERGQDCDSVLAEQLNFFANQLGISREDGKAPPPVSGIIEETQEAWSILAGGKPSMPDPIVKKIPQDGGGFVFNIETDNEETLRSIVAGIARKHPGLDVEAAIQGAERRREYLPHPVKFKLEFGGPLGFRAACKMAINYYLYSGGDVRAIKHLVPYIRGAEDREIGWFYFPSKPVIFGREQDEILHALIVNADPDERILCVYLEFFGTIRKLVLLNDNYEGPKLQQAYFFDVLATSVVEKPYAFAPTRSEVMILPTLKGAHFAEFTRQIEDFGRISTSRQEARLVHQLVDSAFERLAERYGPEAEVDGETLIAEVMKEMQPVIEHFAFRHLQRHGEVLDENV